MKALDIQFKLNDHLATFKPGAGVIWHKTAINLLTKLNAQRKIEGIGKLSLPNVERRYRELTSK